MSIHYEYEKTFLLDEELFTKTKNQFALCNDFFMNENIYCFHKQKVSSSWHISLSSKDDKVKKILKFEKDQFNIKYTLKTKTWIGKETSDYQSYIEEKNIRYSISDLFTINNDNYETIISAYYKRRFKYTYYKNNQKSEKFIFAMDIVTGVHPIEYNIITPPFYYFEIEASTSELLTEFVNELNSMDKPPSLIPISEETSKWYLASKLCNKGIKVISNDVLKTICEHLSSIIVG